MRDGTKLSFSLILTGMLIIIAAMPVRTLIFRTCNHILATQGTAQLNATMPDVAMLPGVLYSYSNIIYVLLPLLVILSWAITIYDAVSDNKYESEYSQSGGAIANDYNRR